jgi:hypothetical protein
MTTESPLAAPMDSPANLLQSTSPGARALRFALVLAAYGTLSILDWRHLIAGPDSRIPTTFATGDIGTGVWYLECLPFAILHGLNPLVSHYQFAPAGFNLLSHTGEMFPALLVSPITLVFGPLAAFNVALISAPAISAGALFFVLRRLQFQPVAAFIAGAPLDVG